MIRSNLKRIMSVLVIGLFVAMHPAKANSDTAQALENIYQMQSVAYSVLGHYYMFSGLQGDSRYSRKIDVDIKSFENNVGSLTSAGNTVADAALLAKSLAVWQDYKELINTNRSDFLTVGYANARLTGNLPIKLSELNDNLEALYNKTIADTKFKVSKETQTTRKMGLIIKSVVAEYIARSTTNGIIAAFSFNEGGMENQAKIFDKLLENLKKEGESDSRIYKLVDQIVVKWSFISKSVANYNENTVPFIVSTNGDRITKSLNEIGDHFEAKMQAKK